MWCAHHEESSPVLVSSSSFFPRCPAADLDTPGHSIIRQGLVARANQTLKLPSLCWGSSGKRGMCRLVVFSGSCTRCGNWFSWDDLSQQLWCLEGKNNGVFGHCRKGIHQDDHVFDQECDWCTEQEVVVDEGVELKDKASPPPPESRKLEPRDSGGGESTKKSDKNKSKRQRTK